MALRGPVRESSVLIAPIFNPMGLGAQVEIRKIMAVIQAVEVG
ncbi:MAG: hypothetical protein WB780_16660 [Candidatus Acidiferrales bacterium]